MQANTKAKSISHCQGKGSLGHNNRTFKCKNVDGTRTADNITFVKQTIAEAYDECFGAAVERYNAKQKRNDRKIDNYYQSVFDCNYKNTVVTSSDKRKSFYEDLVQIGDMNDTACGTVDGKIAAECLTEYMLGFSKRNPNFHVFNSVIHADEATPHLHIDYIPIGHYKRGVDTQNGLAQALKEMGYGSGKDSINKWRLVERKVLEDICRVHGIEVEPPKKGRGHSFTVDEYKEREELLKEIKLLSEQRNDLQQKLRKYEKLSVSVDDVSEIGSKSRISKNIVVPPDEYALLQEQAKAYRTNKKEITNIRKNQQKIEDDKRQLKEREIQLKAEVAEDRKQATELYRKAYEQWSMSEKPEVFQQRFHDLKRALQAEKENNTALNADIAKKSETIKQWAVAHREVYIALTNMAKAVGMLKYDDGDYKVESLSPKQARLIDSLADYAAYWAKQDGYPDLAVEVEKKIGISAGIQDKINERTPKPRVQGLSR